MRVVIALGGNAMTSPDGAARPADQQAAVARAAPPIVELILAGHQLVLTHGNGPQVGNLLVKNELAATVVPPVPLDWCVAQTQATIGALLLNELDAELGRRGSLVRTAVLVSRTLVDPDDDGFIHPSKPIGRHRNADEAAVMIAHGQQWRDRGPRGWRRVVASPAPRELLDVAAASTLLAAGFVVVCAGGGGIPVVRSESGSVRGVEAVIDKDLAAARLAGDLAAEQLIIATDVEHVAIDLGTDRERPLHRVGVAELRRLAATGAFGDGSMAPKVEAACRFVEQGGRSAHITALPSLAEAAAGRAGTTVLADDQPSMPQPSMIEPPSRTTPPS